LLVFKQENNGLLVSPLQRFKLHARICYHAAAILIAIVASA